MEDRSKKLKDLHAKAGQLPLNEFIRKLIIRLENEKWRDASHDLLCVIANHYDIEPKSTEWLDWLESQNPEELTWKKILEAPAKRKTVSLEETQGPKVEIDMPLTKEQAIWKEAIRRHEKGKSTWKKPLTVVLALALVGLSIYGLISKRQFLVELFLGSPSNKPSISAKLQFHPSILWGHFQSTSTQHSLWSDMSSGSDLVNKNLKAYPKQEINDAKALNWLNQFDFGSMSQDWFYPAYYFSLLDAETSWGGQTQAQSTANLSIQSEKGEQKSWIWIRKNAAKKKWRGSYLQKVVEKDSQSTTYEIIRAERGGAAIYQKVKINSKGIVQWAWWIKHKNKIEKEPHGSVLRRKNYLEIKLDYFDQVIVKKIPINPKHCILPSIWSPDFKQWNDADILLPHSGTFLDGYSFFNLDWEMEEELIGQSQLKDPMDYWSETWTQR